MPVPQAQLTLQLSNGHCVANITGWIDTDGVNHAGTPPSYQGYPSWTADDGGALVTLSPAGNQCTVTYKGFSGSFNLTATLVNPGLPTLAVIQPISLVGPAPAGLTMSVV